MNKFKILYLIISSIVILVLASCSEDVYEGAYKPSLESHYLSVYPRDFEFGNGEETKTGSITSENAWSFSSIPSWLSLSPTSGNSNAEFSATSAMNETTANRTSLFYISANTSDWKQQKAITVSQVSALPSFRFLNLENTSIYLDGTAQTCTIDVETNLDDLATKITLTSGSDGWITASYANKRLTITISANDDGYQRSGRVELWSSTNSKGGTLYITQYKPNLSFNEITSLSFDADGGSQIVKISSDLSWSALSKESWIEVSPSQGTAGDNSVKITVLPSYQSDNRNGKVLFYYKDNQSAVGSISISQSGRYLTATPSSLTLSADENSSGSINIDSNIGWTIESYPDWISFNKNNGEAGKSTVTLAATKNNSLNSRSGTIVFKDSRSGGIDFRVTVTQKGLEFGNNTLEFGWHASKLPLEIVIPNKWVGAVSEDWITLSKYSGDGQCFIDVSVDKNLSDLLRKGIINFTSDGKIFPVSVIQQGQYITINSASGEISAIGGEIELFVETSLSTAYSVDYMSENKDWISVTSLDNGYKLKVSFNNSIYNRAAEFVLKATDDDANQIYTQGIKFKITQRGRTISSNVQKIIMGAKANISETYYIKSEGEYEIDKSPEDFWYSLIVDNKSNTFYVVTTTNTSGKTRNGTIKLFMKNLPATENTLVIEIPITQIYEGASIGFDDFMEDEDWN